MCHGFSHFSGFLHHFVLTKLATSSILGLKDNYTMKLKHRPKQFLRVFVASGPQKQPNSLDRVQQAEALFLVCL